MIFTPEESKQIAEMLGLDVSRFFVSADERYKGEDYYAFPDFSLPEWTGPMQDAVLELGWKHNTLIEIRMSNNQGRHIQYVMATRFIKGVLSNKSHGFDGPYPRALFAAFKYAKEATDVQP